MPNYFVDSTTGNDGDSGLTMDLAWATLQHALEAGALVAGDVVWIRRIHSEPDPGSDISPAYSGNSGALIKAYGWPRNAHSVISSDWTNGSTTVVVDDADMDYEKHVCRWITGPDGFDYLITEVTDASHVVIDREYAGPTVNNQPATIKVDDYYSLAQAIDDSGWTINKAAWNADADDIATIDFAATGRRMYPLNKMWWEYANLYFKSTSAQAWELRGWGYHWFTGCIFYTTANQMVFYFRLARYLTVFNRFIIKGSGAGNAQVGLHTGYSFASLIIKNGAIHNCGDYGISGFAGATPTIFENLNVGVENANGDDDIYLGNPMSPVIGKDVKLGGTNGDIDTSGFVAPDTYFEFENNQKILCAHKIWNWQGTIEKTAVVLGAGDPEKRPGGADAVYGILYDGLNPPPEKEAALSKIFVLEFTADTSSQNYRFYVQSVGALTAAELYIKCEYVVGYDDNSEYVYAEQQSDEAINARANAADWTQYIEVTAIAPAVESRVRITCYLKYFHATNMVYIDPGDFEYLPVSLCEGDAGYVSKIRLHGV